MTERRRNSLLACINQMKIEHAGLNLLDIMIFLYIAENPGIRPKELAQFVHTSESATSRGARRLLDPSAPGALHPFFGLVCMSRNDAENVSRHYFLTEVGVELARKLDATISDARPIAARPGDPHRILSASASNSVTH